jgi:hypothetical protein
MKQGTQKRFAFIGKSMLWSLLLYAVVMLAANWDEVGNAVKGSNVVTVVNNMQPGAQSQAANEPGMAPVSIAQHSHIIKDAVALVIRVADVVTTLSRY